MKAIIYKNEAQALEALQTCNSIPQGEVETIGDARRQGAYNPKPYTKMLTHPAGLQWAIVADSKVEKKLKEKGVTLTPDWFNAPNNTQDYGKE